MTGEWILDFRYILFTSGVYNVARSVFWEMR